MSLKHFTLIIILFSGFIQCVHFADNSVSTIKSWPVDVLLDRLVLLRSGKIPAAENYIDSSEYLSSEASDEIDIVLLSNAERLAAFLNTELLEENRLDSFLLWLKGSDPLAKWHTRDLSKNINRSLIAESFYENVKQIRRSGRYYEVRDQLETVIDSVETSNSYEYAYGREVGRKIIKQFDAIHRQTFFENKVHNVDIGIDFLEPVKAILRSLKLKEKFQWIFDNVLYIGYKSSFKHHKKVFMRFKGFYAKTSVSFELMRRKRHWWGYGSWEIVGTTSKVIEEPMAIVGTDVKELEPSQN